MSINTDAPAAERPWQLLMFSRSLKKQQKLAALLRLLGPVDGQDCLLITCGDNNGALNWHFKQRGGRWQWADAEADSIAQIEALTGDPVLELDKEAPALAVPDASFDVVMTIDVHEHLAHPVRVNRELARLVRPHGRVIVTTPGGDPRKLANRIKKALGMGAADYGHVVDGYDSDELAAQLRQAGLEPVVRASYSRFFTEMVELLINFAYVKLLARKSAAPVEKGQIAPQTEAQLRSVARTYRLYSLAYPVFWLISRLDLLLSFGEGYAAIVVARKD